jgi:selenium metabolism protein YedF
MENTSVDAKKLSETTKHVIAVTSNRMGHGPDSLGELLIRACINSIPEVTPLPETIVFYNSGIEFVLQGSPVLESLMELEKAGVTLLVCGTCVKHFNQKDNVAVGTVSNMYAILEALSRAHHVVSP